VTIDHVRDVFSWHDVQHALSIRARTKDWRTSCLCYSSCGVAYVCWGKLSIVRPTGKTLGTVRCDQGIDVWCSTGLNLYTIPPCGSQCSHVVFKRNRFLQRKLPFIPTRFSVAWSVCRLSSVTLCILLLPFYGFKCYLVSRLVGSGNVSVSGPQRKGDWAGPNQTWIGGWAK